MVAAICCVDGVCVDGRGGSGRGSTLWFRESGTETGIRTYEELILGERRREIKAHYWTRYATGITSCAGNHRIALSRKTLS